jgi:hypothetical protein
MKLKGYFEFEYELGGKWYLTKQPFIAESFVEISNHKKMVLDNTANIRNVKVVFEGNS